MRTPVSIDIEFESPWGACIARAPSVNELSVSTYKPCRAEEIEYKDNVVHCTMIRTCITSAQSNRTWTVSHQKAAVELDGPVKAGKGRVWQFLDEACRTRQDRRRASYACFQRMMRWPKNASDHASKKLV